MRLGDGVEFGGKAGGLGRADPLEYLQSLPQEGLGLRGVVGGQGAAAQGGQCVSLGPGAGDGAGLFEGLLVAPLSLREVAADPVQRPFLVEHLKLTGMVAEVTIDAQGLVQGLGGGRVIARLPPHDPEVEKREGLAEPVADVTADAQGLPQYLGCGRVITGRQPYVPPIGRGRWPGCATAARRTRVIPGRLRRAWHPVPRLRVHG